MTAEQSFPGKGVIVGGGLAGMAAAVALESAGLDVTLIEARRTLGGRAGSFVDPQTGEKLDNCQHVLLGCCTNLIDFYRRIGVSDRITWEKTIYFADQRGKLFGLYGVRGLPAPLNLGPSLARFSALSSAERAALVRAMLGMMRMGAKGRVALSDVSFGDWLNRQNQPAGLITKLYDPIVVSGLNEETRRASAAHAIHIFQDALLANTRGYVMGLPNCPLEQLYATLSCLDVRLSTRVSGIRFRGATASGVDLVGGEFVPADIVVLATNYHAALRWVPHDLATR